MNFKLYKVSTSYNKSRPEPTRNNPMHWKSSDNLYKMDNNKQILIANSK
jgi:hypothetical protein